MITPRCRSSSSCSATIPFFLNRNGLNIVEPSSGAGNSGSRAGTVVELANWTDSTCTSLAPHEPQATETVLSLEGAEE